MKTLYTDQIKNVSMNEITNKPFLASYKIKNIT